ncbi:MAG: ABC transporter substrate-binding protein [Candidatus Hodarchaeota archaeon]
MKKNQSIILLLIVSSMFLALQINSVSAKVQADEIKIGALGPLAITPGKNIKWGAELAVKEINDAGGVTVGGTTYKLKLITRTTSDPSTGLPSASVGIENAKKLLVDDDVTALLGLFRTEVALGVMGLPELDRPLLGTGASAPITSEYFWRITPSNVTQLGRSLIDLYAFGMGYLGIKKITIVRENAGWTLAMRNNIEYYLHTALPYAYNTTAYNFTTDIVLDQGANLDTVTTALNTVTDDVDALMTIFSGPAGTRITEAWASLDMPQYLAGINVEAQKSTHFDITQGAAYGEIELETLPPDITTTQYTTAFRTAFEDKTGELPAYTGFGARDAVYVIKDALERADSTDAAALQAALATTDLLGSAYKIKFTSENGSQKTADANGDPMDIPGAPTGIIVHDLYTTSTVGVLDETYIRGYFAQWQQNGTKKTVWTRPGDTLLDRGTKFVGYVDPKAPVDHDAHGWVPTPTESSEEEASGFELSLVLLTLGNLAVIVHLQRRKKR